MLVATDGDGIVGTVSLIDDGRVAWLFRFAVDRTPAEREVARALYAAATEALRRRGHTQVLVYTPVGDDRLARRYAELGMTKGGAYNCSGPICPTGHDRRPRYREDSQVATGVIDSLTCSRPLPLFHDVRRRGCRPRRPTAPSR